MTLNFILNRSGDHLPIDVLPHTHDYSPNELESSATTSTAVRQYLDLVKVPPPDKISEIRIHRNSVWLECALSVLNKKNHPRVVCSYWSHIADEIVQKVWALSGCDQFKMALFALGKWGSFELNLSSDIDVIFVSSENPTQEEFSAVKKFIQLLSEKSEFGFCFRVDTDLKPGGRLAPIISSLKQLEDYYWSSGATWERLALVRLRSVVGDSQVIAQAKETIDKFVFRRHIDYALLEDLKHLRTQIHNHQAQKVSAHLNLKLSPGGIRDIELFIHALQVIHGGKNKLLRTTSTTEAAELLIKENRHNEKDLQYLIDTYWYLRHLENYVQALGDRQTHEWDMAVHGELPNDFQSRVEKVNSIVEDIIGKPSQQQMLPTHEEELLVWVKSLNYDDTSSQQKICELVQLTTLSTKTYYDEEMRLKVLRIFITKIAETALDKNLAISLLVDFFKSTRAKAGFFSFLIHEERLINELSILFGCSPYLGGILAARPELLDSYIYRAQAPLSPALENALEDLAERKLLNEIITANQFLLKPNIEQLCSSLTTSADEICLLLLDLLKKEYGASELQFLALGKWGGKEMGFKSDLDFIMFTPDSPTATDQKIARRILSRLTEQHKGGNIFAVDMRLRPTGKAGPILVSNEQLLSYITQNAEPWERQSYLRARVVGDSSIDFARSVHQACCGKKLTLEELQQLLKIRNSLIKPSEIDLEIKYDHGGLIDVEFAVQIAILTERNAIDATDTLSMIRHLENGHPRWAKMGRILATNYEFLRKIEQYYQLATLHPSTALNKNDSGFLRVAKLLNTSPDELNEKILNVLCKNSDILKSLDLRQVQT